MQQHRDTVERCKATIKLAENLIQEREERYRAALAKLNEAAMMALFEPRTPQYWRSSVRSYAVTRPSRRIARHPARASCRRHRCSP